MVILFTGAVITSCSNCNVSLSFKNKERDAIAVTAAEEWLAMIDEGNYTQGWEQIGEVFKNLATKESFDKMMSGVRKPLGKLNSRKVKTTKYSTSLPGAPDGEYVTIQFETSFENKKSAIETVVPMLEKDGKWRVVGYYIK